MKLSRLILAAGIAALAVPLAAHAQYPAKPVVAQPETRAKLQSVGVELFEDNQANFRGFFVAEIEKWRKVVKAANLKLE